MSKTARSVQTEVAKTNWTDMAKLLFRSDGDEGRHDALARLHLYSRKLSKEANANPSYNLDQMQYLLLLMLVLTTAEKRTQEMYQQQFAQRCDEISANHGLSEDQYWIDGKIPDEWQKLDEEFEKRSVKILLQTLREYSMDEIANHVESAGPRQFLEIIGNTEPQFLSVLRKSNRGILKWNDRKQGSIPETLQATELQIGG
jgi:hypothetical protein